MSQSRNPAKSSKRGSIVPRYDAVLNGVVGLVESARGAAARAVNSIMTATYWEVGRRIVECEQAGAGQADYGAVLVAQLAEDLTERFGRGFSKSNLYQMRAFYLAYREIFQTVSGKFRGPGMGEPIFQTVSGKLAAANTVPIVTEKRPKTKALAKVDAPGLEPASLAEVAGQFPLPWSHYILLLKVEEPEARQFYEVEALRCGWTVRQLERQITTLFYERTIASKKRGAKLRKGTALRSGEEITPEEAIKDPLVLEFLALKDEYSETDLEEALICGLESFLLELGGDFAFVGRQKRLRIGDEWYRLDLLFFHRKLRCLIVIDLKLGKFTHNDVGQMQLYLNYAKENWTNPGENPPVGIILCTQKDNAVVHYALGSLANKVLAAEYRIALPGEETLAAELERKRRLLEARGLRASHK